MRCLVHCCAALLLADGLGCGRDEQSSAIGPPPDEVAVEIGEQPVERAGLGNVLHLTDGIYSGSEPDGEQGFASLVKLGVKTVVSVDGSKPNVELARRHGLRYVHIPIGYDGVAEAAGLSLARLVKEAERPIYIHCHHGKHRGPAAAAVACIAAGEATGESATDILRRGGTSQDYAGLWRDVRAFRPPPADAKLPELVETAEVGSFAAAMAQLDRAFDHLKLCRAAKWATPPDHPDIVPAQEALLVREGLHEAGRELAVEYDQEFRDWLGAAEGAAQGLEHSLRSGRLAEADARFTSLDTSCKQCHAKHRDK